jgi:hypothetical protein
MTEQHPITPPTELVHKWALEAEDDPQPTVAYSMVGQIAAKAAQWGADQELEACCEWFVCDWTDIETADKLRSARRPKPPSLKEQALEALDRMDQLPTKEDQHIIRRALETLDD